MHENVIIMYIIIIYNLGLVLFGFTCTCILFILIALIIKLYSLKLIKN